MPSPFPGMDPWLEGPHWMSVHSQLCSEIARQLSPKILPRYVALTTERQIVDTEDDIAIQTSTMYPDVAVVERPPEPRSGGAATLEAPLKLRNPIPRRVPHVSVEIRDVEEMRLVTAIEVLSPTNKRGQGYREYLRKRNKILRGTAHLLEIDLLREGKRRPLVGEFPHCEYSFSSAAPTHDRSPTPGPFHFAKLCHRYPSRSCRATTTSCSIFSWRSPRFMTSSVITTSSPIASRRASP